MSRHKKGGELEEAEGLIIASARDEKRTLLEQFNGPRRSNREKKTTGTYGDFLAYDDNDDDEAFINDALKDASRAKRKKKAKEKDSADEPTTTAAMDVIADADDAAIDDIAVNAPSTELDPGSSESEEEKSSKRKKKQKKQDSDEPKKKKKRRYIKKTDDDYAESDVEEEILSSTDEEFLMSESETEDAEALALAALAGPTKAMDKILGRKLMLPSELDELKATGLALSEDEIEKYWYLVKWKNVSYLNVSWESVVDMEKLDQSAKFKIRRFVNKRRGVVQSKVEDDVSIEVDEFEKDDVLGDNIDDSREVEYYPAAYIDVARIIGCDKVQTSVYHACRILSISYKPTPDFEEKDDPVFTVEEFEKYCVEPDRDADDEVLYLVKWHLLGYQDCTWERFVDIRTSNPDEIFNFWKRQMMPSDALGIAAGALSTNGHVSIPISASDNGDAPTKMVPLKRQITVEGIAFDSNMMFARPPQSLHVGLKRSPVLGLREVERAVVIASMKDKMVNIDELLAKDCDLEDRKLEPLALPPAAADDDDDKPAIAAETSEQHNDDINALEHLFNDDGTDSSLAERKSSRQQVLKEKQLKKAEDERLRKFKDEVVAKEKRKLRNAQKQKDIQEYQLDPQIPIRVSEVEREEAVLYNQAMRKLEASRSAPPNSPRLLSLRSQDKVAAVDDEVEAILDKTLFLRPYQVEGINWLTWNWFMNRSCILADEMGLGKTIQALAFLQQLWKSPLTRIRGPFLVVAPLTLISQWYNEASLWCPDLNVVVYHGNVHARQVVQDFEFRYQAPFVSEISAKTLIRNGVMKLQILLTTYEMVIKDAKTLSSIHWRCIIVDEAHRLKNSKSRLSQQLALLPRDHSIMMTGTPLQNKTEELWSLLHFADAAKFANLAAFMTQFGDLTTNDQVGKLHDVLKPYLLRRVKEDVEKSLPPKEETLIEVSLTLKQKQYYRAIYERNTAFLFKGAKGSNVPSLMNIMMELRKCCNHPYLIRGVEDRVAGEAKEAGTELDKDASMRLLINCSGKLVLLDKLLPKLRDEGHKVLIFSQMVRVLDVLEQYVRYKGYVYERLDGSYHALERSASVERFNKPSLNRFVMLLSTRAGGLGLNLTAADTVIIYDSDWNPHNDIQAQARAHRIGQTRHVMVYRLLTTKTYEMHMFHQASMKLGLDRAVLAHTRSTSKREDESIPKFDFKASEIDQLLKRGAYDVFTGDDSETQAFVEADIDQILKGSARRIMYDGNKSGASSFSKASFVTRDNEEFDIAVDDPDFWEKSIGLKAPVAPTMEELLMRMPAQRNRKILHGNLEEVFGSEALQRIEEELSGEESSEGEAYEEEEEDCKKKFHGGGRPRSKPTNSASKPWGLHARDRLVKCLTTYGIGRWRRIQRDLCSLSLAAAPRENGAKKETEIDDEAEYKLRTFVRPHGVPFQPVFRSIEEIRSFSFYFLMQCGMMLLEQERFEIENPPEEVVVEEITEPPAAEAEAVKETEMVLDAAVPRPKKPRASKVTLTPLQEVDQSPFMTKIVELSKVFEAEFNNRREEFEIDAEIVDPELPKPRRGRKKKKKAVERSKKSAEDEGDDDDQDNNGEMDEDGNQDDGDDPNDEAAPAKKRKRKKPSSLVFSYDDSELDEDTEEASGKKKRPRVKSGRASDTETEVPDGDEEVVAEDGENTSSHRKTQRIVPESFFPSSLLDEKFLSRLRADSCSGVVKLLQKIELMLKLQETVHHGCSVLSVCKSEKGELQASSSTDKNIDDVLELASKDQLGLIADHLPIGEARPSWTRISPWWDDLCDRHFLIGVYYHGYGKYDEIAKDIAKFGIFSQKIQAFKSRQAAIAATGAVTVMPAPRKDAKGKVKKVNVSASERKSSMGGQFDFSFTADLAPSKLVKVKLKRKHQTDYYGVYNLPGSVNWIGVYCPPLASLINVDCASACVVYLGCFEEIDDAATAYDIEVRNRQEAGDEGSENVILNFCEDESQDLRRMIPLQPSLDEIEALFIDAKLPIPWYLNTNYKPVQFDGRQWYSNVKLVGKSIPLGPFSTELQAAVAHDICLRMQMGPQTDSCFLVGIEMGLNILARNNLISCDWEDPTAMPKYVKIAAVAASAKEEETPPSKSSDGKNSVPSDDKPKEAKPKNPRKKNDMPDVRSLNRLIVWLVTNEEAKMVKSNDPADILAMEEARQGRGRGRKKKRDGFDNESAYKTLALSKPTMDLTKELTEDFVMFYLRRTVSQSLLDELIQN